MNTQLDHLVIVSEHLEQGAAYIRELLQVDIPFGGCHDKMGTHNLLMQLSDSCFLEVIAVNPNGTAPDRPRWFGLDDPLVRQRIKNEPALMAWVVNTPDLDNLVSNASYHSGKVERFSRGALSWYFSLPEDGRLLGSGCIPYAIQWLGNEHPARDMTDCHCRLIQLDLYHPYPEWLSLQLASIGAEQLVRIHPTDRRGAMQLKATIQTASGQQVTL